MKTKNTHPSATDAKNEKKTAIAMRIHDTTYISLETIIKALNGPLALWGYYHS